MLLPTGHLSGLFIGVGSSGGKEALQGRSREDFSLIKGGKVDTLSLIKRISIFESELTRNILIENQIFQSENTLFKFSCTEINLKNENKYNVNVSILFHHFSDLL